MYGHSQYLPFQHQTDNNVEWWSNREMEFTKLNTADGDWHMVTAPRTVLQCKSAGKREGQQDQDGEFYTSLPRAHFLRPGYFCTASEPSAFSPYSHDLHCKGKGLQDRSPRDRESYGCIPPSSRPHPLAQPGFYSPKIPRSKHCEPASSPTNTTPNKNTKEFNSYTLPLPHTRTAVLSKSDLSCKPQGFKTSLVEKPRLMRATVSQISPDLNHLPQQQQQLQHNREQNIQNQYLPSQHQPQTALNIPSTDDSRKEESPWNYYGQPQSNFNQFHPTPIRRSLRVPKHAQESYDDINHSYRFPRRASSISESNIHLRLQSSSFCKLSVFNGKSSHNTEESEAYLQSSPPHANFKGRNGSSDVGSNLSSSMSQMEKSSKNVFGQPRMTATLRPTCSPRPVRKTTIVEDLKKLIVMDDILDKSQRDSPSLQQTPTSSTFSELMQDSSSPSPVLSRRPLSRPSHLSLQSSPTACHPMSTESPVWDRDLEFDHGLLPLPNTAPDIDWDSLVSTAEAYEMQKRTNILSVGSHNMLSGTSTAPHSPAYSGHVSPSVSGNTDSDVFTGLPDQLSHLEVLLRRLSRDLLKEKKDKVALLAEVLKLRMSNQHLKEESVSANAQLYKICRAFNISAYGAEDEGK
uniref:Signal-induced proliferation-associated 1-like protein 1 n=1 Tax=Astyanax mexicanus TaxID=7994 RepID=A0A3B1K239_ASTMX